MIDEPEPQPIDARILATLEQILAVQTELLNDLRRAQQFGDERLTESLELQRQAAQRAQISMETQRNSARLYRRVVLVAGMILLAAAALGIYVSIYG